MARVSTPTLLSLDHYAEILGLNLVHFNQILCAAFPEEAYCQDVWMQYAWMLGDKVSREDLGRAIAQAERVISERIDFMPAPEWIESERIVYPKQGRFADGDIGVVFRPSYSSMRRKTVQTRWQRVLEGGRRRAIEIEADATVLYSSPDGDSFDELATISTTYSGTLDAAEVCVFQGTDTFSEDRIRPLNVSISGNNITITGHAALFVDEALWERSAAVNGDDPNSFIQTANVYRVYTEDQGEAWAPVVFEWELASQLNFQEDYGVLRIREPESGVVIPIPSAWLDDAWTAGTWSCVDAEPNTAKMWYRAGWDLDRRGRMSEPWARAVAAYATALLAKPICGCTAAERLAEYWRERRPSDMSTFHTLECPFGPQEGAWEAFQVCVQFDGAEGFSL